MTDIDIDNTYMTGNEAFTYARYKSVNVLTNNNEIKIMADINTVFIIIQCLQNRLIKELKRKIQDDYE